MILWHSRWITQFSPLCITSHYITCMIRYIAASCRGSDANTTAAADNDDDDDDDDASQCDVIATHPEHPLLSSMDSCPATRFAFYYYYRDYHGFCCGSVIHCVQKKHPLTFSFTSPWVMCRFKQKLQWIYLRIGRFWPCRN